MNSPAGQGPAKPFYRSLQPGDPAPVFKQRSSSNPNHNFSMMAGRYLVLCFFGSAGDEVGRRAIAAVEANREVFDDDTCCLFGVSIDPSDEAAARVRPMVPGVRYFWDFDRTVGQLYGATPVEGQNTIRRLWVVVDPMLRIRAVFPFKEIGSDHAEVFAYLRALPPVERFAGFEIPAPILILPNVFDQALCRHLITLYDADGGTESGFMREIGGKTVGVHDRSHKSRRDYTIEDPTLMRHLEKLIRRRVSSEIEKVQCFRPTHMERYIVSCYAAEEGGHFRAHRDNTTKGTAHRRFAVSINLNHNFEGGEVSFPEYGPRSYKAPPGGAVVFSCSLLHAVSQVTLGRRYAFLPFLYDEAAARIRRENSAFIASGTTSSAEIGQAS